jgi:hypothetical protein
MSEQHKLAAARRGAARTAQMEQQVTDAMRAILADMQSNDGIYPHNGGAVSMAELARRARISESSFYKKEPENLALKEKAVLWLDTLKKKETVGRMRVKKTLSQRAEDWRQKHDVLQQRHICTELELQASKAEWEVERKELTEKITTLKCENAALTKLLKSSSDGKVTPLRQEEK